MENQSLQRIDNAVAVQHEADNPQWLMRRATDVAGICREIVQKTAQNIQGRKYVKVEGWMAIATTYGCVLSARDVEKVDGGVRAIADVKRLSDGAIISSAEGFVGVDEPAWFGGKIETREGDKILPKRADYAIRAMAQTRAMSRAARTAFAFVVVLIDTKLDTTPAEEVPEHGFDEEGTLPTDGRRKRQSNWGGTKTQAAEQTPPKADTGANQGKAEAGRQEGTEGWENCTVHFGKNSGTRLGDMNKNQLQWYANPQDKDDGYKPRSGDVKAQLLQKAARQGLKDHENAEKEQNAERGGEDNVPN